MEQIKKTYSKPIVKVIEIESHDLLTTSDSSDRMNSSYGETDDNL